MTRTLKTLFLALAMVVSLSLQFSEEAELNRSRNVHIIFASSFEGLFRTRSVFQGFVDMALDWIHAREDIIQGYKIVPHYMDSMCDNGYAIFNMVKELNMLPARPVLVGPLCSQVCRALGECSHHWNITMLSPSCVDPDLSNKNKYPRFFRISEPETAIAYTRLELMKLFGWRKVSVFYEASGPHPAAYEFTRELLTNASMDILTMEVLSTHPKAQVSSLMEHDARIIMGGSFPWTAREFFCEVYKHGLFGPHIIWMLPGYFDSWWWKYETGLTDCTAEQLLETIQDALYIDITWTNPQDEVSISGLVQSDMNRLIEEWHRNKTMPQLTFIGTNYYDATIAMALGLNLTETKLREKGDWRTIADFNYNDTEFADLIKETFFDVSFQGVSGYVRFNEFGDRPSNMLIHQQKGNERIYVGWHDKRRNVINWEHGGLTWRRGKTPVDSTLIILKTLFVLPGLYKGVVAFSAIGIVVSIGFMAFNIYFKNMRVIKMSSPNINTLILIGCTISYVSVVFEFTETTFWMADKICMLKTAVFTIGFSIVFGGLFSKTWRVHIILTKSTKTAKKTVISDVQLFLIVGSLVLIDVLVLITWQLFDPYRVELRNLTTMITQESLYGEFRTVYQIPSCNSDYATYFQGALFVIQGMMLAFGAFLAWETRKVTYEALNDSKLIGVCIYNVAILSIIGAAISMVIVDNPDAGYGFTSVFKMTGTILVSAVLFVPKILAVQRKEVGPIRTVMSTGDNSTTNTGGDASMIT